MTEHYRYFDSVLASDILFPELEIVEASGTGVTLRPGEPGRQGFIERHAWIEQGDTLLRLWQCKSLNCLEVPGELMAGIDASLSRITVGTDSNADPATTRHLLLDHILPRLFSARGEFVLHASAVVNDSGDAVAFCGPSGAGKSTLAASFCRLGWQLVTDDALLVRVSEGVADAMGAYPGLRLDPASALSLEHEGGSHIARYTCKKRFGLETTSLPVRLRCIFVVEEAICTASSPLTGRSAVFAMLRESFSLDPSDREQTSRRFSQAADLTKAVPCHNLARSGALDEVSDTCNEVLRVLALYK